MSNEEIKLYAPKVYTPQFALAVHAALVEIGSDMDLDDAAQMLWTQTDASMDRDTLVQALRSGAANKQVTRPAGAGELPFPQAWPFAQRIEAASAFLARYSDTNMGKLLDYEMQPIVRTLAAMIGQWQQAAAGTSTATTAPAEAPSVRDQIAQGKLMHDCLLDAAECGRKRGLEEAADIAETVGIAVITTVQQVTLARAEIATAIRALQGKPEAAKGGDL